MKPSNIVNLSRRRFLKTTTTAGAGLTLGVYLPAALSQEGSGPGKTAELFVKGHFEPNAFVRIDSDDTVRVIIKHLEMGQGTYTGLATLVAEELDATWAQVVPEGAPADPTRYNNLFWGPFQGTGGSTAMANSFQQMRKAGAAARHMILAAAAEVSISQGVVSHAGTGKNAGFGALAEKAARQPVPEEPALKNPQDFVFIGKQFPRKDGGKVDGTAIYTQDVKLDGLLTAVVAHPPRFGAKIASFDGSKAKAVRGVAAVVQVPSGVAALILAAGGSSRLGQPKQRVTIDGVPLVRRAVRSALDASCEAVFDVLGASGRDVRAALAGLDTPDDLDILKRLRRIRTKPVAPRST